MTNSGVKKYIGIVWVCLTCLLFSCLGITIKSFHDFNILQKKEVHTANVVWKGSGVAGDPYLISTPDDLIELMNIMDTLNITQSTLYFVSYYYNSYFQLTNDIDMTGRSFSGIGVKSQIAFAGNFDGNGYTIKGLNVRPTSANFSQYNHPAGKVYGVGLFGRLTSGAHIKNLRIVNSIFDASGIPSPFNGSEFYQGVGAIAGAVVTTTEIVIIENCMVGDGATNEYTKTTGYAYHGGIVGLQATYSEATQKMLSIKNCDTLGYSYYFSSGSYRDLACIGPSYGIVHQNYGGVADIRVYSYTIERCLTDGDYQTAAWEEWQGNPGKYDAFINKNWDEDIVKCTSAYPEYSDDPDSWEIIGYDINLEQVGYLGVNSYANGTPGAGTTAWYRNPEYKYGLPRLRVFMKDWTDVSFEAINGVVYTPKDAETTLLVIQVPADAELKTDNLSIYTSITVCDQRIYSRGNTGYPECSGWTFDASAVKYTITFVQSFYYIQFGSVDGVEEIYSTTGFVDESKKKIQIFPEDVVKLSCIHDEDPNHTLLKYEIGTNVVIYKLQKKYTIIPRNLMAYGTISITPEVYDITKPNGGVITFALSALSLNYDKLEHGAAYNTKPTLSLKSYNSTFE